MDKYDGALVKLARPITWTRLQNSICSRHKITSVLGQENVSLETPTTHRGKSRKSATRLTPLLSPKLTTLFGTWNVRTMFKALKAAQIAAEIATFKLSILAINETRWNDFWVHKVVNRTNRPSLRI